MYQIFFLFEAKQYSVLWVHILFICLSIGRHLGCFYLLAVVSNAAVKTGVQIPAWIPSFGSMTSNGIAGSHGFSMFNFTLSVSQVK